MDIITHAAVGLATGCAFGQPVAGVVAAVIADAPIWDRRRYTKPPTGYDITHSVQFWLLIGIWGEITTQSLVWLVAYGSHIFLDLFTHGKDWGPRLWYPDEKRYFYNSEWEWFNPSWWIGFHLALFWITICLFIQL